jgi:hypothetical protein
MTGYAFWNEGTPRVLRTTECVKLPSGKLCLKIVGPIPSEGLYRYQEASVSVGAHQRLDGSYTYTIEDNTIIATPQVVDVDLEVLKQAKLQELAAYRYKVETGGLALPDGTKVGTDREDCAIITGKSVYFDKKPQAASVKWKGKNGFVEIPRAQFELIAIAVAEHVQSCFDREADLALVIEELETAEAVANFDVAANWTV